MTARSPDVLVVGAGVFGAAAAAELGRRGRRVVVLEQGTVPHPDAASTDISKLVRLEYGSDAFYTELMEVALTGWRDWNERWPEPLFHETGLAILSSTPMVAGGFELESFTLLSERGHPITRVDADEIARRLPAWRPGVYVDGYINQAGGWAESGRVVSALVAEARGAGVEVRENTRALGLVEEDGAVVGVRTSRGTVTAGCTVVAPGAWVGALLPELAGAVRPVGQPVIHFAPPDPAAYAAPGFLPWAADISRTGWYGFCANADGVVKVANHGPGRVVDPEGPRVIAESAETDFRKFLEVSLPSLAQATRVGSRLCLYSDSRDGDPWVGAVADRPGLLVASGGSGHGFKLAPLVGAVVADAVEGRDNPWSTRFAWRDPTRRFEEARFSGE